MRASKRNVIPPYWGCLLRIARCRCCFAVPASWPTRKLPVLRPPNSLKTYCNATFVLFFDLQIASVTMVVNVVFCTYINTRNHFQTITLFIVRLRRTTYLIYVTSYSRLKI